MRLRLESPPTWVATRREVVHAVTTMDRAVQVMIDADERRRARRRAAARGLTLSEYVARLIHVDLEAWQPDPDQPAIIPVLTDEPPDHHGMNIGEAVAARMNNMNKSPEPEL